MGRVAEDGMRNVLHVSPQLMASAGKRFKFHLCVPYFAITSMGDRQGAAFEGAEACLRWQTLGSRLGEIVGQPRKRMVDQLLGRRPASHNGPIGFSDTLPLREPLAKFSGCVGVKREGQYAAGCFIKPVHRKNTPAQLVAQGLQHDALLARVKWAGMYQPACRLGDDCEVVIEIEERQTRFRHGAGAA